MAFFKGTLQEGIAAALQQGKSVACFVTDGEAESQQWEDEFFAEEEIRSLLQTQAVSLRLPAGSQEEGFLAQLYPIPKKPTIVIIRNAELKEYIAAGVSKDEFMRRMKAALTAPQPAAAQPAASPTAASQPPAAATTAPTQPTHPGDSSTSSTGQTTPPPPAGSRIQSLLAERAARLAEKKAADEEAAKRQHTEKKAETEASNRNKNLSEPSKHAAALRKKQQDAREERQRILKAIEDDKAARRAQKAEAEAERKAAAAAAAASSSSSSSAEKTAPFAPASQLLPSSGKLGGPCAIQVRLLDGATLRSRFSCNETLADVRKWVDENGGVGGGEPYVFKVLLPSRTVDVGEEGRSLAALGLAPSSTLILLRAAGGKRPAKAKTSSAASSFVGGGDAAEAQGNVFQQFIAYILAVASGVFGTIVAFFTTLFSTAGAPDAAPETASARTSQSQPAAGAAADAARRRGGGRIAGLGQTEERRNDQQFYNGNSTNFEPRADDGE